MFAELLKECIFIFLRFRSVDIACSVKRSFCGAFFIADVFIVQPFELLVSFSTETFPMMIDY